MKVSLEGYIIVPLQKLEIVQEELEMHVELTKQEEGCLSFRVTPSATQVNRFEVFEEFSDRRAFEAHQERVKNSKWGFVTQDVERHYKISG